MENFWQWDHSVAQCEQMQSF